VLAWLDRAHVQNVWFVSRARRRIEIRGGNTGMDGADAGGVQAQHPDGILARVLGDRDESSSALQNPFRKGVVGLSDRLRVNLRHDQGRKIMNGRSQARARRRTPNQVAGVKDLSVAQNSV